MQAELGTGSSSLYREKKRLSELFLDLSWSDLLLDPQS
jgi:hypothetical protein